MSYNIDCVTVCVGYADFLAVTAPINFQHFRKWVIVTTPEDQETLDVCHKYNLNVIQTNDFKRDGTFNKGRGIQRGLNALSCKDWVLHLDADIVLPNTFHNSIEMNVLNEKVLYGCDRMMVKGWKNWHKANNSGYHQLGRHCYVLPHDKYPIGARWASPTDGYVPIGFFQLFHGSELTKKGFWTKGYPAHHGDAARSDVQFGLQWDRENRQTIPELLVWHLESEEAKTGANWNGRTTKPFRPECESDSVIHQHNHYHTHTHNICIKCKSECCRCDCPS